MKVENCFRTGTIYKNFMKKTVFLFCLSLFYFNFFWVSNWVWKWSQISPFYSDWLPGRERCCTTESRSVFAPFIMTQEAFCVIWETATKTRPQLDLPFFIVHFLVLSFPPSICLYLYSSTPVHGTSGYMPPLSSILQRNNIICYA